MESVGDDFDDQRQCTYPRIVLEKAFLHQEIAIIEWLLAERMHSILAGTPSEDIDEFIAFIQGVSMLMELPNYHRARFSRSYHQSMYACLDWTAEDIRGYFQEYLDEWRQRTPYQQSLGIESDIVRN